jgi:hypothetical protein
MTAPAIAARLDHGEAEDADEYTHTSSGPPW